MSRNITEWISKATSLIAKSGTRTRPVSDSLGTDAERVETIKQLIALDIERVKRIDELRRANENQLDAIARLSARDEERVETINRLSASDAARVAVIEELVARLQTMDGISVAGRNLAFLDDPLFKESWEISERANAAGWPQGVPDLRWRAHIALWAARHGLSLEGDFVECGVHTGLLSLVICHALKFADLPRTFFLFDTFNGIPLENLLPDELERTKANNSKFYGNVLEAAKRNFRPYPNAKLIAGVLPASLNQITIEKIAYLSVDLNNVAAERGVIVALWDKLVPGAVVLIDDYAWAACEPQKNMWDEFARGHGLSIATLPTGQGLLIKTPA